MLRALGDLTRLEIVLMLRAAKEPACVCDFTAAFSLSQPTISHHLKVLREAGIVDVTRQGIWAHYRLAAEMSPAIRRVVEALG